MLGSNAENWNRAATSWARKGYFNKLLAEHKRKTYLGLIDRWADVKNSQRILKTDLFTEAFGEEFLPGIARVNSNIVGIDISHEIVARAKRNAKHHGIDGARYFCCNITHLPLRDSCIDLVISDSTLDHFPSETDIVGALHELNRVLTVGGTLILSMDNKTNLTYPPYFVMRLWMWLGLAPYFIGTTLSLTKLTRALEEMGLVVEQSTAIFHYPHPDALVRWLERWLHKVGRDNFDNAIRRGLALLDRLEEKKTKYLTGRYIAVKAVKQR